MGNLHGIWTTGLEHMLSILQNTTEPEITQKYGHAIYTTSLHLWEHYHVHRHLTACKGVLSYQVVTTSMLTVYQSKPEEIGGQL